LLPDALTEQLEYLLMMLLKYDCVIDADCEQKVVLRS
jgi:hypothetical protein